jgi:hypothetical protein
MCEISKIVFDFKSKGRNDEGIVCDGGQSRGLEHGMEEKVFRVEVGLDYKFTGEVPASELFFGG